jgi:hypothetical protein
MILYFIALTVLLYLFVGFLHYLYAVRVGNELGTRIKKMDILYEQAVNRSIESADFYEYDKLSNELTKLLEPSVISMVSFINKSKSSNLIIKNYSRFFPNLIQLFEAGLKKHSKKSKHRISDLDIERIKLSIKEAILADIQHRLFIRTHEHVS